MISSRALRPLVGASGICLLFTSAALAVNTPYSDTPAAIVANDGLLWDNQFASLLNTDAAATGKLNAKIIWVADFCYSGGFVNNLLSSTPTVYAAAAANWDETSTGNPTAHGDVTLFGQTFMQQSVTKDLGTSFANASAAIGTAQTPQAGIVGAAANGNLGFNNGDQAIIFSAGDHNSASQQTNFWNDIKIAHDSLINNVQGPGNGGNGWAPANIHTLFDNGQTVPAAGNGNTGAAYNNGASTVANLASAINAAYVDPNFTNSSKLFIYMNDHGINSDVVKSKVTVNGDGSYHYSYQADITNYKPTGAGAYGMWDFDISTKNLNAADIFNITTGNLPAGWTLNIINGGNTIEIRAASATAAATWLHSGTDYNFGYDSLIPPARSSWIDYQSTTTNGNFDAFDFGVPDTTPWGSGATVYDQSPIAPNALTVDPAQWAGWDNGGDGWVESPVPEPTTFGLIVAAGAAMTLRRRRAGR